jgi:hypothetical protein
LSSTFQQDFNGIKIFFVANALCLISLIASLFSLVLKAAAYPRETLFSDSCQKKKVSQYLQQQFLIEVSDRISRKTNRYNSTKTDGENSLGK